jgi:hypothetical protein
VGGCVIDISSHLDDDMQIYGRESHAVARASGCLLHGKTHATNTRHNCVSVIKMPQKRHAEAPVSRLRDGAVMMTSVVLLHYCNLIGACYLLASGSCQHTVSALFANERLPCVSKLNGGLWAFRRDDTSVIFGCPQS